MTSALSRREFAAFLAWAPLLSARAWARDVGPFPAPDRDLMVPVEGGQIYVRINGQIHGPRPPLLLVHGGPGGMHDGYLRMTRMASERAIILYDQLDCGRSERPNDPRNWYLERFVHEIDAIRAHLGIERLHLLGHSFGGAVCLEYGARRPVGLNSLILSSPLISTRSWIADSLILRRSLPPRTQATITRCLSSTPPPAALCDEATGEYYAHFARRFPIRDTSGQAKAVPSGVNMKLYETMWGKTEFEADGTLRDFNGEPLLKKLEGRRTLFMCGEFDEARPATVSRFARQAHADFKVITGAAHGTLGDQPEQYMDAVGSWLRAHDS